MLQVRMPCGARLEIGWLPVRKTVDREDEVHAGDHIDVEIKLLPILEQPAQDAIVREELEKRGWERQPDGSLQKVFGDAIAVLPPDSGTIRLLVEDKQSVSATASATETVREEDLDAQAKIEQRAAAAAEAKLADARDAARAELVRKNIDRLLRVQEELQREVAEVVTESTKRSLERRAAELGSIESINESRSAEHGYEITITVKT